MSSTGIVLGSNGTATWTIRAEDSANFPLGSIPVTLTFWPGIPQLSKLYGYWPLDESSGTRNKAMGIAASANLAESGGAVASAAGKFGLAVSSTAATTSKLLSTVTPVNLTGGFAVGAEILWSTGDGSHQRSLLSVATGGIVTDPSVSVYRYFSADLLECLISTAAGTAIFRAGPISENAFHSVVFTYNPTVAAITASVDGVPSIDWNTGKTSIPVSSAIGSLLTALDTINVTGAFDASFQNWDGRVDALMLWKTALTANEQVTVANLPSQALTITGSLLTLNSASTPSSTTATWTESTRGWTIALTTQVCIPGQPFTSTLTFRDAQGNLLDLASSSASIKLTYSPQGSQSKLPYQIPTVVTISGHIYYTQYAGGTVPPRPTPIWVGVTVSLYDNGNNLLGTVVSDSLGAYSFVNKASAGQNVYVKVTLQLPPSEVLNETKTSATFSTTLGDTVVDLTCDRLPI